MMYEVTLLSALLLSLASLTLANELTTIIAVSVPVGLIGLVLVGIVIFVWVYLCLSRSHIWDKAPLRKKRGRRGKPAKIGSGEKEKEYSPLSPIRRSKSLTLFKTEDGEFPFSQDPSASEENLLSRSHTVNTELTGLEHDDDLDFDLNLDESLFEHQSSQTRTKSESNLNRHNSIQDGRDQSKLPKRYQRASDRSRSSKEQAQTPLEPWMRSADSPKPRPTIERQHRSFGDLPVHQDNRRTSTTSDHSDFSSDFIPSEATRSHNSSLFKSVRFEIEDDPGTDSGHVTGASTPYYPERRASEPEFKAARHQERRSSAPECSTPESVSDEGSGNDVVTAGSQKRTDEEAAISSKVHANDHANGEAEDKNAKAKIPSPSVTMKMSHDLEGEHPLMHSPEVTSNDKEQANIITSTEQQEIGSRDTSPNQSGTMTTALLAMEAMSTQPQLEMPAHVAQPHHLPTFQARKANVAHLIEQWKETALEPPASSKKETHTPLTDTGVKISEILQRFQQQTTTLTQPEPQKPLGDALGRRPSKQMSKLVTDTTKLLLEPPPPAKEKDTQVPKPQKLTVQWPNPDERYTVESPVSSTSSILTASVPTFDLAGDMSAIRSRDAAKKMLPEFQGNSANIQSHEEEFNSTPSVDEDPLETENDNLYLETLEHDTPSTDENIPWFERLPSIPVFTTPFAQSNWQPSHLKSSQPQQLSSFWSFTGQANKTQDKTNQLRNREGDDSSSSSEEDEDMLQPLMPSVGFTSISPIGKTLFSSRSQISPAKVRFQMADMKKPVVPSSEPFPRPAGSFQHQKLANRLSSIPEESPELTRSARSSVTNITAASLK